MIAGAGVPTRSSDREHGRGEDTEASEARPWATLTEIETEDALEELAEWVSWAVERYALDRRVVPACWDQHGALVEELSALRTAWIAGFCVTSRPEAPLEWHAQLAAARQRLSDWSSRPGCRRGEHRSN